MYRSEEEAHISRQSDAKIVGKRETVDNVLSIEKSSRGETKPPNKSKVNVSLTVRDTRHFPITSYGFVLSKPASARLQGQRVNPQSTYHFPMHVVCLGAFQSPALHCVL